MAEKWRLIESKYKEITSENKKEQWLSKKNKEKQLGKYHRDTTIKMGGVKGM